MSAFTAYPKRLLVEMSDRCNLKCFICVREEYEAAIKSPGRFLELERLKMLETALSHAESIQINGFGETFLHPRLKEYLDYIYSVNPNDNLIKCVSNGTALSRDKAGWLGRRLRSLHISLNAANAESYWREMHPHEYAAGKDGRHVFDSLLEKIRAFADGLEPSDRKKIHLHYVCHRDNFAFMADYVRLAADLGLSNVTFTPYKVNRPQFIERCLYWYKEDYNDAADAALEAGEELNVSVVARKFFSEAQADYIPERDCRWVTEEAQVSITGEIVVCCPSEYRMDGSCFSGPDGFEAIWFGDQYNRLRRERYLPACKVCNELTTFDDIYTHFEHNIKLSNKFNEMISSQMESSSKLEYIFNIFTDLKLDFDVYRRTARSFGVDLSAIASEPAGALTAVLERRLKDAFTAGETPTRTHVTIRLSEPFPGYGWGGFYKNVHGQIWRWLNFSGAEGRSVLLLRLVPGYDYLVETLIHTAPIAHYLKTLAAFANDLPLLEQRIEVVRGQYFLRGRIPAAALAGTGGRLRLAFDAGDTGLRQPRELGLALSSVTISPADGAGAGVCR